MKRNDVSAVVLVVSDGLNVDLLGLMREAALLQAAAPREPRFQSNNVTIMQ